VDISKIITRNEDTLDRLYTLSVYCCSGYDRLDKERRYRVHRKSLGDQCCGATGCRSNCSDARSSSMPHVARCSTHYCVHSRQSAL